MQCIRNNAGAWLVALAPSSLSFCALIWLALGPLGYRISASAYSPFQSRRCRMAVVNPLPKEKAAPEVHETYEGMTKRFGRVPNIFGTMAHRPNVLKNFLPFYGAVMNEGTVEPRYKELAYLKTSLLNGCEY